ncbi:MAG: tetratricopeptide repeat protein [Planctomycetota bacterium]
MSDLAFSNDTRRMTFWWRFGPAMVILVAGALAYANSFRGLFMLDDFRGITDNVAAINSLWPPSKVIWPLYITRPVVGYSFALCYQISELNIWSYHLFNLVVHLLATLTLFGIVWRTLLSIPLRERFGAMARPLALFAALFWMLHPLQTQAVTYIVQRCESMMGLFYLLTLYCVIRGADSKRERWWWIATFVACALGMGSKEVMVTAPVVIFFYDRAFLAGSFKEALRRRRLLYAGLALTWFIPTSTLVRVPNMFGAGFGHAGISASDYACSQFGVILHYLRLSVWPHPLCLDYLWPTARGVWEIAPPLLIIAALVIATVWALVKKSGWGFVGAWFFAILAPTSSIVPIMDLAFEQRMYVPLAAVVIVAVIGGYSLMIYARQWFVPQASRLPLAHESSYLSEQAGETPAARENSRCSISERTRGRLTLAGYQVAIATAVILALLTARRNETYHSSAAMWSDVLRQRPLNYRAQNNYGLVFLAEGKPEAEEYFRESLRLNPYYWQASYNLGIALARRGETEQAIAKYEETLAHNFGYLPALQQLSNAYNNLGLTLRNQGKFSEAEALFRKSLGLDTNFWPARYNLGLVLANQQQYQAAIIAYHEVLKINPDYSAAREQIAHAEFQLAAELSVKGKNDAAILHYTEALRYLPNYVEAGNKLAEAMKQQKALNEKQNDLTTAAQSQTQALQKNPADQALQQLAAHAHNNLGLLLLQRDGFKEATASFQASILIWPKFWQGHYNLGIAFENIGKSDEAIKQYRQTINLNSDYAPARHSLANVLNNVGVPMLNAPDKLAAAELLFREACQLSPTYWQAPYNLGLVLNRTNRLEEAIAAYSTAIRLNPNCEPAKNLLANATQELKAQKSK